MRISIGIYSELAITRKSFIITLSGRYATSGRVVGKKKKRRTQIGFNWMILAGERDMLSDLVWDILCNRLRLMFGFP